MQSQQDSTPAIMDMHQAENTPDWSKVPAKKRNIWQHMAADTQGIGTPGNVLSVIGFCLLVAGLWVVITRSLWEGTALVSAGRLADVIDGMIADRTGTKSPLGRALDAALDKTGAFLALFVFTWYGILPLWVALASAAQNIANIAVSVYAPWRNVLLNPSYAGKIATAGFWLAIVTFVVAHLLHGNVAPLWYAAASITAYIVAAGALVLGTYATLGYIAVVRGSPPHRREPGSPHEL